MGEKLTPTGKFVLVIAAVLAALVLYAVTDRALEIEFGQVQEVRK